MSCDISLPIVDTKCPEPKVPNYQGLPVYDVRAGEKTRERVNKIIKANNGNMSKYIPGKWGYGEFGARKY